MALPGDPNSKDDSQKNTNSGGPNPTDTNNSKASVDQEDRDFDPTAEALIDEIDDERTLEEEEALGETNAAAVQNELDDLKRESEMSIEELMAHYGRMRNETGDGDQDDQEDEDEDDEEEIEEDNDEEDEEGNDIDDEHEHVPESYNRGQVCSDNFPDTTISHDSNINVVPENNRCIDQPSSPKYQPQGHSQSEPSLPDPPQQSQITASGTVGITPANIHVDNPIDHQQSSEEQANQLPNDIELRPGCHHDSNPDDSNAVSSTGRHRHSMTEFMLDPEAAANVMFKTLLDYDLDDSDDMDEDYSYTDDENDERDLRRVIHVGPEFQAEVPEGLCYYEGDLPPYETEDKVVWRCNLDLTQEQILDYLKRASLLSKRNDISISPASVPKISDDSARQYRERMQDAASNAAQVSTEHNHENSNTDHPPENLHDVYMSQSRKRVRIDYELEQENAMDGLNHACGDIQSNRLAHPAREDSSNSTSQDARPELSTEEYFQDEEQLLYLLLQCNYNFEEASRRRKLDPFKYYLHEPMSLWSQDECLGFEHGLRIYGKDFLSIRENKVPTRTRAEVVAFYYLWKKSERHDVYTNQYKLDRKRCLSHPGTTDYMDKFIEDNESVLNASSSNPTPTPTDSTADVNQFNDTSQVDNTLSLCQTSEIRASPNQCLNVTQEIVIPSDHCEMQQPKDDDSGQSNSVFINSNTST